MLVEEVVAHGALGEHFIDTAASALRTQPKRGVVIRVHEDGHTGLDVLPCRDAVVVPPLHEVIGHIPCRQPRHTGVHVVPAASWVQVPRLPRGTLLTLG